MLWVEACCVRERGLRKFQIFADSFWYTRPFWRRSMKGVPTFKGIARGEGPKGEPPPPETEKSVENGVISEGSIFSKKSSKYN